MSKTASATSLGMKDARLERLAEDVADPSCWVTGPLQRSEAQELIDEVYRLRRELELERAKTERFRTRCPVFAEDVKAAKVAAPKAEAWFKSKGSVQDEDGDWEGGGLPFFAWSPNAGSALIASTINSIAEETGQCAFAILEEMAAS
jgi:hypothetical protein